MSRPVVVSGEFTGVREPVIQSLGWGRMRIDPARSWEPYTGEPFAIDNGVYRQFSDAAKRWSAANGHPVKRMSPKLEGAFIAAGMPGLAYDRKPFERFLTRYPAGRPSTAPFMIVAPDLLAGGMDSLGVSLEAVHAYDDDPEDWHRAHQPWYLAVQNGMTPDVLEQDCYVCECEVWRHFAGVFLGGTKPWKLTCDKAWCDAAHALGLRFHYARAATPEALRRAHDIGADSIDGTTFMWQDAKWHALAEAWRALPDRGTPAAA